MTFVFSKVRVNVAKGFVRKFPEHVDFAGMLQRVTEEVGVSLKVAEGSCYKLEGLWSPMGQVHDFLVEILQMYGASGRTRIDEDKNSSANNVDEGLVTTVANSATILQDPTFTDKSAEIKNDDADDECEDENHEYNTLKNTISDICSSLGDDVDEKLEETKTGGSGAVMENNTREQPFKSTGKDSPAGITMTVSNGSQIQAVSSTETNSTANINHGQTASSTKTNSTANVKSKAFHCKRKKMAVGQKTWKTEQAKCVSEKPVKKSPLPEKCYIEVNTNFENKALEDSAKFINNFNENPPKLYQCIECDFTHKVNTAVREHFSRIHRAKPTKCEVCSKVFPSERYAKRHCGLVHSNTQYCCDMCGKIYKTLRTLEEHLKSHKDGYVKPDFPCETCDKSFSSLYVLKCHIKSVHFGEHRTYLCPICGKNFTTKHSLNMHQNTHSGVRPFTCNVCGKGFMYDSALRDHKFIHSGKKKFACEICNKAFQQRSGLQMHAKIHQEKKAFECKDCGRAFIQKQSLQRHERSHKGEKPFMCKICGRYFGDSGIIRRHLIMVHKINKDAKSWREDIIEKGREDTSCESNDLISDSVTKETQENESQNGDIHVKAPCDKGQNHMSQLNSKYQESCIDERTLPPSLHVSTDNTDSPIHEHSVPHTALDTNTVDSEASYIPPAHTFIPSDYCRPLPLSTSSLEGHHSLDIASYNLHPYQYANNISQSLIDTSRYHYSPPNSAPQTLNMVTGVPDGRYTAPQGEPSSLSSSLPRVDSVLNKCLHDMEPPENLSISSLYAYYTNLASQYLNASQYQGFNASDTISSHQE